MKLSKIVRDFCMTKIVRDFCMTNIADILFILIEMTNKINKNDLFI